MTETDGAFWKHPIRKSTLGKTFVDKANPDEVISVDEYLAEFDIKDAVNLEPGQKNDFIYTATQESSLAFNVINGFKSSIGSSDAGMADDSARQSRELISKLEQPGSEFQRMKNFTITPNGVFLRKGEEVGMFQMGSTIVMLFECPKNCSIVPKEGEKLLMGQKITAYS